VGAAAVLADLPVEHAVALAAATAVVAGASDPVPAYELWRRRVRAHFVESGDRVPS
jgi:hypothetical protein